MAAGRCNLTRRAVLGASVGVPIAALGQAAAEAVSADTRSPFALSLSKGCPSCAAVEERTGLRQAQPERVQGGSKAKARWTRTLAAYRRAEARVAGFKAAEALLPAARRRFPACAPLEEEFGRLDSLRLAALRRLFRLPAPDLPALALKLDLAVADQAWELSGCESCLAAMAGDAHRLAANPPA